MKIVHLSNRPLPGRKVCSLEQGALKRALRGAKVICYRRWLSHNQVDIAKKVAEEVRYA